MKEPKVRDTSQIARLLLPDTDILNSDMSLVASMAVAFIIGKFIFYTFYLNNFFL